MQWIATLIGRTKPVERPQDFPCVLLLAEDGVRLEVLEKVLVTGEYVYRIRIEMYLKEKDEWVVIADLLDCQMQAVFNLLASAKQFVDSMHGYFSISAAKPAYARD